MCTHTLLSLNPFHSVRLPKSEYLIPFIREAEFLTGAEKIPNPVATMSRGKETENINFQKLQIVQACAET